MKLTSTCPYCNKPLHLENTVILGDERIKTYKCGHAIAEPVTVKDTDSINFASVYGDKQARQYQQEGVKFIINSNFNCVLGDQQRLGKTPQSLLALQNEYEDRTPCLIVVRATNLWQWIREYKVWTDPLPLGIYPITGGNTFIPPGFKTYIISMDLISRNGILEKLLPIGFKLIIADEVHSFKNTDSKRSMTLVKLVEELNMVEEERPYRNGLTGYYKVKVNSHKCGFIGLSGTPIKNRADELFIPLNICDNEKFSSLDRFRRHYLVQDDRGRWSRVNPWVMEEFKSTIAPYYLRREKEDVYEDYPPLNRMWTIIKVEDEALKRAYNNVLTVMENDIANGHGSFMEQSDNLMLLRRICGISKVDWLVDYLDISLEEEPNERYAVGIHHIDVRNLVAAKLASYGTMQLSGTDNAERKDWIMRSFATARERILVMNMLAGGVGMDFHYVNKVIILERQWSSADEEQFEYRFYNPDKSIKNVSTDIEYILAQGTIDEWWYNMVEEKRAIFGETVGTHWDITQDSASFKQLLEETVTHRL